MNRLLLLLFFTLTVTVNCAIEETVESVENTNLADAINQLVDNAGPTKRGYPPLILAILQDRPYELGVLIRGGADVNVSHNLGSALMYATLQSGCNNAVVELLLEAGAKPDVGNMISDESPLHVAASQGNLKCVQALLDANASVSATTFSGTSVLHEAALGGDFEVFALLAEFYDDIDVKHVKGGTPLMLATLKKNEDIVRFIISKGGDPCLQDNSGNSAASYARSAGLMRMLEFFPKDCKNGVSLQ